MKTERTLFTLTENQKKLWNDYDLCRNACENFIRLTSTMIDDYQINSGLGKDLIYTTIKKMEDNEKARNLIYDKICKDYDLTEDEATRLDINPSNGVVRILDKSYNEEDMQIKRFKRMWR